MRFLIASDIHGSAFYCRKLLEAYREERADRLLLLGDLLYHGPRNDLPKEYAPKEVIEILNAVKERIICVRGNCEAEVDQMVLEFPVMAEYAVFPMEDRILLAAHGHNYCADNIPPMCAGDILLNGHTHVPACRMAGNIMYMNPGSVSIPKQGSRHSYMIWEGQNFVWKDVETMDSYQEYRIEPKGV